MNEITNAILVMWLVTENFIVKKKFRLCMAFVYVYVCVYVYVTLNLSNN